ncbi:glycosyltransferase family 4 protein [Flavobacterium psychraquaticum]|uniref:glycosyltransferase family 4 protein n=1 Tax=Flavobacterium psychraquaticum TaxID=3103958 RepID=UPI002ACE16EF|nr:glycosyltransferase family 4 protein [Flavobacterium sp. LB-N7T]
MIYKVLVGNEHGGAAASSKAILDNFIGKDNFKVLFLCNSRFSKLFKNKSVISLNSFEPPIIGSSNFVLKAIQNIKFVVWIIITTYILTMSIRKHKVKVIHTTNNHALLICLLCKLLNPKLYIISHWRCVGLASSNQYQFLLKKIDKVICISLVVKSSLPMDLQLKSTVIYNGVDVHSIYKENIKNKSKLSHLLNLNEGNILLGTIGSFTPIKCHDLIINCFIENKLDSNIKVVLIGSCPNQDSVRYLKYLKNKVSNNDLQDQIYFLEDHNIYPPKNYIANLDLFIGATWNNGLGEGFGLIYVESMAAKVPVLAIDVGAAGEIIKDGVSGYLISSNSTNELFSKINKIDFNRISDIKNNAFDAALNKFDISCTLLKLTELYEEYAITN